MRSQGRGGTSELGGGIALFHGAGSCSGGKCLPFRGGAEGEKVDHNGNHGGTLSAFLYAVWDSKNSKWEWMDYRTGTS